MFSSTSSSSLSLPPILKNIQDFNTFICRIYPSLKLRCHSKVMFECCFGKKKKLTIFLCVSLCSGRLLALDGARKQSCQSSTQRSYLQSLLFTRRGPFLHPLGAYQQESIKSNRYVTRQIVFFYFFVLVLFFFSKFRNIAQFRQICKCLLALFFK